MKSLTIETANALLSVVRIIQRGKKLYFRATLPLKPGQGGLRKKQQDIATGLDNSPQGLKIAFERAKRLESDIYLEKFQWSNWIDIPPDGQITCQQVIDGYTKHYWDTRKRTPSREYDYNHVFIRYFKLLPPKEPLTCQLLTKIVTQFEVDTFYRHRCFIAFNALAKWAEIPLSKQWPFLRGNYKPQIKRVIPSDDEIENLYWGIKNPGWRWIFGILAAYGLRPHEIWFLDLSRFPVIRVGDETKTGSRLVYPLPWDWPERWGLKDRQLPKIDPTGKRNQQLGSKISRGFRQQGLPITPYYLRDAYAIRGVRLNFNDSLMSLWMGHTVGEHSASYLSHINEKDMERVWQERAIAETGSPPLRLVESNNLSQNNGQKFREDLGKG